MQGGRVGALVPPAFEHAFEHSSGTGHVVLLVPESMAEYGRTIYELLREFDRRGCDVIVASLPPREGLGLAIADRLRRAAAKI